MQCRSIINRQLEGQRNLVSPMVFYLSVALLATAIANGQENQTPNLIRDLKSQCRIINRSLVNETARVDPNGYNKTAAALCAKLAASSGSSDATSEAKAVHDLYQLFARMNRWPASAPDRFAALQSAASGKTGPARFYALTDLAKVAFEAGEAEKATGYAQELLHMAAEYPKDWNYGNAIYYGHFVLGRVALEQGNTRQAVDQLLAAGATPGSPQLNSFGPNVTLARDLLAAGQVQPVLEFLAQCKRFWRMDSGHLDEWISIIRAGGTPVFTTNLNY